MSNEYTFNDRGSIGKKGVDEVRDWLLTLPEVCDIIDVGNDKYFQNLDIDLIKVNYDLNVSTLEVKTDTYHRTGNLFFETISNTERGNLGNLIYTEASHLYYYFIGIKTLYIIDMIPFRKYVYTNMKSFEMKTLRTKVNDTYYTSVGKLIPLDQIIGRFCGEGIIIC